MNRLIDVIVSGHLCLDLLPSMEHVKLNELPSPGHLFEIGPMTFSTGGAVSNTGLALQRLGVNVRLMSNVGDDAIGHLIRAFLDAREPSLTEWIRVKAGSPGSYTLVLSPEKVDRIFLHWAGTNATFNASDVDYAQAAQAKLFHLGYPALLPGLLAGEGEELASLLRQVYQAGTLTSLDSSLPDPQGASGRARWQHVLAQALPFVDVFIPSIEEILFMLRRADYDRWKGDILNSISAPYLDVLADELLAMGACAVVGFKLGELGVYLRGGTPARFGRWKQLPIRIDEWANQRVWHPAFEVQVLGTTGAGDSAYAGFLTAALRGLSMEQSARWACAVGACNVEAVDATSGIRTWNATQQRIAEGWAFHAKTLNGC